MAARKTIFTAGPSGLPLPVLEKAQAEFLNWNDVGCSVMELSHRSAAFESIINKAIADIRTALAVPDDFEVLFMTGGGTGQFAAVPLNLAGEGKSSADYFVTGNWSKAAAAEAAKYCDVNVVANVFDDNGAFNDVPAEDSYTALLNPNAAYVYICDNETVNGVEYPSYPDTGSVPLVVDASSNCMSRAVDFTNVGVYYAGAQKNIGPAGVTLVIVRKSLLGSPQASTPVVMNYTALAKKNSMHNTPPTYPIYLVGLVVEWVLEQGGVAEMEARAATKSGALYAALDESDGFYIPCVAPGGARSRMNVTFNLATPELEAALVAAAKERNFMGLKGHRSVGGIRASLYNAVSVESVEELVAFLNEFRANNSGDAAAAGGDAAAAAGGDDE